MNKFRSRFAETEGCISQLENSIRSDSCDLRALQIQVNALQEKEIDTENRLRRNNICILGLLEQAEVSRPAEFAETFLPTLLDLSSRPPTCEVERVHRVPPTPPILGNPPRPFLLKLLNYRERNRVLAVARVKQDLRYNNAKILLFPDYSPEVEQRQVQPALFQQTPGDSWGLRQIL